MFEKNKMPKVKIFFKSGNSIELEAEEFSIDKTNNKLSRINWKGADPNIMFISLEDVEAIFEI